MYVWVADMPKFGRLRRVLGFSLSCDARVRVLQHPDTRAGHAAQVVRRQGRQEEAIALLQEWLAIIDESGLSLAAGEPHL